MEPHDAFATAVGTLICTLALGSGPLHALSLNRHRYAELEFRRQGISWQQIVGQYRAQGITLLRWQHGIFPLLWIMGCIIADFRSHYELTTSLFRRSVLDCMLWVGAALMSSLLTRCALGSVLHRGQGTHHQKIFAWMFFRYGVRALCQLFVALVVIYVLGCFKERGVLMDGHVVICFHAWITVEAIFTYMDAVTHEFRAPLPTQIGTTDTRRLEILAQRAGLELDLNERRCGDSHDANTLRDPMCGFSLRIVQSNLYPHLVRTSSPVFSRSLQVSSYGWLLLDEEELQALLQQEAVRCLEKHALIEFIPRVVGMCSILYLYYSNNLQVPSGFNFFIISSGIIIFALDVMEAWLSRYLVLRADVRSAGDSAACEYLIRALTFQAKINMVPWTRASSSFVHWLLDPRPSVEERIAALQKVVKKSPIRIEKRDGMLSIFNDTRVGMQNPLR